MTAIITKQNALDKAFINSDGGGGDYPKDATFDTIKVNKEATFTVEVQGTAGETLNQDITFSNHESRIKTLEQSGGGGGGGDSSFSFSSGYPEIIITKNLTETNDNNTHTLTININNDTYKDYVGDLIEFTLPSEMMNDLTTAGVTQSVKISKQSGIKFTCPVIEYKNVSGTGEDPKYKYVLTNTPNQDSPFIRMISALDYPLSLFTSGNMEIKSIVKQPTLNTTNNIKCNLIDADNALTLYRSPLPNLYEMIDCGEIGDYWYAYWGYDAGSDEFKALMDGQEFHFEDNAFGTSYTLTKQNDKWDGDHVCYNTDAKIEKYNITDSDLNYGWIFIDMSDYNKLLLSLCGWNEGSNPFEMAYQAGFITSNYELSGIEYGIKDNNKWYMKFTEKDWDAFRGRDDEPPQPNLEVNFKIAYGNKSTAKHKLKISIEWSDAWCWFPETNLITKLELDCISDNNYPSIEHNNGLMIFMHKNYIYPTTGDLKYQDGTNPFEYLRATDYYNVEPRPEACSTLYTTYNIRTTGNIIGQNIESHVFALNSLGNDVDRAIVRLSQLQQYVQQLFEYIEAQLAQINETMNLMQLGSLLGGVFSVLPGIAKLMGTAMTIESAAVKATTGTFEKLALDSGIEMEVEGITTFEVAANGSVVAKSLNVAEEIEASAMNVEYLGVSEGIELSVEGTKTFEVTADGAIAAKSLSVVEEIEGYEMNVENITVTTFTAEGMATFDDLVASGEVNLMNVTSNGTAKFNKLISTGAAEFEDFISTGQASLNQLVTPLLYIEKPAEMIAEDFIDGIIKDVDVLAPKRIIKDLELIVEVKEASAGADLSATENKDEDKDDENKDDENKDENENENVDDENEVEVIPEVISNKYKLDYVDDGYKLALTSGELIEYLDYDSENKRFEQPTNENVQINYDANEHTLTITGQLYDNVQIEYIKQILGIGPNDLGAELTNNKILTAKAVKKLIDNNLKHSLTSNADIERRLAILEAKCKNMYIDTNEDISVHNDTLSIEERLQILELKCANIKI